MLRSLFSSLRFRSMLLVLLVIIPAFGLILYLGLEHRRAEIAKAQDDALRQARLAAFEEEQLIGTTRQVLVTLAQLPQVRGDGSATCNALMTDLRQQFQRYANLGVIAMNGNVFCSAVPLAGQVNVADRDYFQRTLQARDFAIGDYQVGRITRVPSINFGYPVLDEVGQIKAVVFAALDLDWLNRSEYQVATQLPQGSTLTKIDADGIILVRRPDPEKWIGRSWPESSLTRTVLTQDHGVIPVSGADGVPRVYAFSSLRSMIFGNNLRIILGIPEDALLGEANRRLALSLAGLGIVALLAFAAAWIGGDVFILRRVNALVKTTKQFAAGDLSVRTGLPHDQGELGQLSCTFDEMAESLEQRVAERTQAENALHNKVAALQTLAEIDREIIAATEPHVILDLVCRRAAELMRVPKSAIAIEVPPDKMQMAASHGLHDPVRAGAEFACFWWAGGMRSGDLSARGTFALDDIPADYPHMPETLAREDVRAFALAPLAAGEQSLGALLVLDTAPRVWRADEIQVLSLLAGQTAIGIENARLYEEARRHAQEVETLNQVGQKLTATLDVDKVIELLGREAGHLLRPGNFAVDLYDETHGEIQVKLYLDKRERQEGFCFPFGEGLVSHILIHEESIRAVDYLRECEKRGVKAVNRPAKAWLGVPMIAGEKALGALLVWDYEREGVFGERDVQVLSTLAAQAAIALVNARLFEAERQQRELAETLRQVGATLVATLDVNTVLDRLLEQASRVVPNDVANVMLIEGDYVRTVRRRGYERFGIETPTDTNAYPMTRVPNLLKMTETGKPVVIPDTQTDPDWIHLSETDWQRSYIGVPIQVRGAVIGFLNVSSTTPGFFTPKHAEWLRAFADQAAIALENARLFSETRRRLDELAIVSNVALVGAAGRPLDEVVARATDALSRLWPEASHLGFLFVDETGHALHMHPSYQDLPLEPVDRIIPIDQGLTGWAVRERQPIRVGNVLADSRYLDRGFDVRSEMVAPLVVGERAIGVINVESPRPDAFSDDDLRLLATLAGQLATIFEKVRLDAALEEERALLAQRVEERTVELNIANAELRQAARAKDEFLAGMSHELRTPLNAILGMSEVLQEQFFGPLNEKQLRYVHTIEESGQHLLALINDILDLSKVEAGKVELQISRVVVESVCQASLQFIKEAAHRKQIKVSSTFDNKVSTMQADERRLKQILVNLLSNAVKFTPQGGEVGLKVLGDAERQLVHFVVWDTGIGISQENIGRLFQPFVQLDSSLSRQYSGTGLGLSLVKRLAQLHGGSVSVESEVGKGSRFIVSLPWRVVSEEKRVTSDEERVGKDWALDARHSASVAVLLAEDSETDLTAMSDYLSAKGYRVIVARNGSEAIRRAREDRPDVVLMDIQMPGMDGLEAIRHIRAEPDPRVAQVPIIALTAIAMSGDRERCMAAGANEYMSKPVSLKELVEVIETQLTRTQA